MSVAVPRGVTQPWGGSPGGDVTLGCTEVAVEGLSLRRARASQASTCQAALLDPLHRVTSAWQLQLRLRWCLPMVCSDQTWRG